MCDSALTAVSSLPFLLSVMAPLVLQLPGGVRAYVNDSVLAKEFLLSMSRPAYVPHVCPQEARVAVPNSNISGDLSDHSGSMSHVSSQVKESPKADKATQAERTTSTIPEANIATPVGQNVQDKSVA